MPATQSRQIRFEKVATDRGSLPGTFWRSNASTGSLRTFLRGMMQTSLFKVAGIGGSTEQEFEQAFSSLGYAYMKDKAPRLLDFMIGFQLVDRNEDNTKAMGLFGFQVGGQWLYAPVFFLNGDLKGHELLYVKAQDAFRPMKENWVNYLMSRKPHILGEPSDKNTYQLGGLMPDIYSMSQSPTVGFGTRGSDSRHIDEWAKPALPLIASLMTKSAKSLFSAAKPGTKLAFDQVVQSPIQAALAEVADKLDLNQVMSTNFALLKTGYDLSQAFPAVKQGFDKFYGKDCFSRWGKELQAAALNDSVSLLKRADAAIPTKDDDLDARLINDDSEGDVEADVNDPIKSGELKVLEHTSITVHIPELDNDERAKLLKDTVLIKDKRDPQGPKTSKAYNTQVEMKLVNPSETGLYDMMERPGDFSRMLILTHPYAADGQQDFCTVVRIGDSGSKAWINSHRSCIWADKVEVRTEFDKWFEGLGKRDSLTKGGMYVAISENGQGSVPFTVRESYGDGAYKVDFKGNCDYSHGRPPGLPHQSRASEGEYVSNWGAKLYVDGEDKNGTKIKAIGGELRIPGNFKFLKLQDPPKPKKQDDEANLMPAPCCDSDCESDGSKTKPIQPGKLEDIQVLFYEKTAALKVFGDHNEVTLRTKWAGDQRCNHRKALVILVRDHGFTEKAARDILGKAGEYGVTEYRVHYAPFFGPHMVKRAGPEDAYALRGGPGAPPYPPPQTGIEMFGGRQAARAQYPDEAHTMVPELDSSMVDPSHRDMWRNYTYEDFQQTMGQAQQAAQQGQKEVFDTSMISGMLKSVRQDTLVDRYLGDLLKALDKIGRILFMFYWHQEEFEDRYGKQDLPELEDSLRNAFETLGDVTLFLKEKTIEPSYGEGMSEPAVEEAARG